MLLSSSDTRLTLQMRLFLFTLTSQRELVSICTQSIHNRNCLSLPYILAQRSQTIILHITLPTQHKDILDGLYPIITGASLKINDFLLRSVEAAEAIFTGLRGRPRGRGGAEGTCRVGRAGRPPRGGNVGVSSSALMVG